MKSEEFSAVLRTDLRRKNFDISIREKYKIDGIFFMKSKGFSAILRTDQMRKKCEIGAMEKFNIN